MNLPIFSHDITYVALAATLLPPELQVHASAANLCHVRMVDHEHPDADSYRVQVAALPYRLNEACASKRVFTIWVSSEQLAQMLPWDRTLQSLPTCDVREHLEAHVPPALAASSASTPMSAEAEDILGQFLKDGGVQTEQAKARGKQRTQEDLPLVALPEVFVSCETVQRVGAEEAELRPSGHHLLSWARLTWLRAALAVLRHQLVEASHQVYCSLARLDGLIRQAFVVQHRLQQPLVHASTVYIGERQVGWHLQIGVPRAEVLA